MTASPQQRWMPSGLPAPLPLSTVWATTPRPKVIRMAVPKNSARASRIVVVTPSDSPTSGRRVDPRRTCRRRPRAGRGSSQGGGRHRHTPPATSSRAASGPRAATAPSCISTFDHAAVAVRAALRSGSASPGRTTAGRSGRAAPRRPSRSPGSVATSGRPDACADLPLVALAGLRHQPLLDEVQHARAVRAACISVLSRERPVEGDAHLRWPVDAEGDEADLAHHRVPGLVPELPRHVAVVAPRLARASRR